MFFSLKFGTSYGCVSSVWGIFSARNALFALTAAMQFPSKSAGGHLLEGPVFGCLK